MANIKIWAGVRSDSFEYKEVVDLEEEREHFDLCQANGANPLMKYMTFEDHIRPGAWHDHEIDSLNGNHFLFGWIESISQRSNGSPIHYFPEDDWTWFVEHKKQ